MDSVIGVAVVVLCSFVGSCLLVAIEFSKIRKPSFFMITGSFTKFGFG